MDSVQLSNSEIEQIWHSYNKKRESHTQSEELNTNQNDSASPFDLICLDNFSLKDISKLSVEERFQYYETNNFIYPEKKKRLKPYIQIIFKNWKKASNDIQWAITLAKGTNIAASLEAWRPTLSGVQIHHLFSNYPKSTINVMWEMLLKGKKEQFYSGQYWYRPDNAYPATVINYLAKRIDPSYLNIISYHYLEVIPTEKKADGIQIKQCTNNEQYGIFSFVKKIRGHLYAVGEELNNDDIELEALDAIYQQSGLRRRRYIWMAYDDSQPLGAVIANRGPFGINLSFIENKCDILLAPNLDEAKSHQIIQALLYHAKTAYFNNKLPEIEYPINYIPVTADKNIGNLLMKSGAKEIRKYNQAIWLSEGFEKLAKQFEEISPIITDQ
jgi:hypothetical protein